MSIRQSHDGQPANGLTRRPVIPKEFTLGNVAAERDQFLLEAFFEEGDYKSIASREDRRGFVIGRTGSGKSAALRRLREQYGKQVIEIDPESISLQYLRNINVLKVLSDKGVRLDPFLRALWKHVILVEIIQHRYDVTSFDRKESFFSELLSLFSRDRSKTAAIDYWRNFGDDFWLKTSERIDQITKKLERTIEGSGGLELGVAGAKAEASASGGITQSEEVDAKVLTYYESIVNDQQLPNLNQIIKVLDRILDSEEKFIYVVIDDLDKDLADQPLDITLIRCLFEAVLDLMEVPRLKIIVALRTNIFRQLDLGVRIPGWQEEKVLGTSLIINWARDDLYQMIHRRMALASARHKIEPALTISRVLPGKSFNYQRPFDFILGRTLMQPRDLIAFLNLCFQKASEAYQRTITWRNILDAEVEFSSGRLRALRDEWKDPYLDIDQVFEAFHGRPRRLNRTQMWSVLTSVSALMEETQFGGKAWLGPLCKRVSGQDTDAKLEEFYGPLLTLLYNIGFLGVVRTTMNGEQATFSYHEPSRLNAGLDTRKVNLFEVHPAFRYALQMAEPGAPRLPDIWIDQPPRRVRAQGRLRPGTRRTQ
jgi:hypothetical protein